MGSDDRAARLHLLANNSRFLVMPGLSVRAWRAMSWAWSCAGSERTGSASTAMPSICWRPLLERERFAGTGYESANWIRVGQTKGRTRQDTPEGKHTKYPSKTFTSLRWIDDSASDSENLDYLLPS